MLFSSLDTLLKLSKTTSPQKTFRIRLCNAVFIYPMFTSVLLFVLDFTTDKVYIELPSYTYMGYERRSLDSHRCIGTLNQSPFNMKSKPYNMVEYHDATHSQKITKYISLQMFKILPSREVSFLQIKIFVCKMALQCFFYGGGALQLALCYGLSYCLFCSIYVFFIYVFCR